MEYKYSGCIVFDKALDEEGLEKLKKLFPSHNRKYDLSRGVVVEDNVIAFESCCGDSDVAEKVIQTLEDIGYTAVDGIVNFSGDSEGRFKITRDRVVEQSTEEAILEDADPEKLRHALESRGYTVTKADSDAKDADLFKIADLKSAVAESKWLYEQSDEIRALFQLSENNIALNITRGKAALDSIIEAAQKLRAYLDNY